MIAQVNYLSYYIVTWQKPAFEEINLRFSILCPNIGATSIDNDMKLVNVDVYSVVCLQLLVY